jgi:hypothetical protein
MISVSKETAFDWLWGTTFLNLGLGALLWGVNWLALENGDFDYSSDAANALAWQGIGAGLWGFGVLVFIITLATSAIVDALGGNQVGSKVSRESSSKTSEGLKSAKNWLKD